MRTHYCGDLSAALIGRSVTLCGWAHRRRDHGGVIFIDLRDREGLAQVVFDPDRPEAFATADRSRSEYVLRITGMVRRRPEGTVNPNLRSGEIEVLAHEVEVLNASAPPPFQLDDDNLSETTRLTYRVLDLRREQMQHNLRLRYRVAMAVRRYLDAQGFIDIETPMLTRSTPEGARDYLVPSRVHPGEFYALPQSPQLFKQLLMVAGFDRYYQIVKCFRDEDLRADRQPEFTQIDVEASFLDEAGIQAINEALIRSVFEEVLGVELETPFPRMSHAEAMSRFGSDKPDLRVSLELTELTDLMRTVEFKVFRGAAEMPGGRVAALRVPKADLTRKEIDDYTEFVGIYGARGLAYIRVNDRSKLPDGLQSPIVKFLPADVLGKILERTGAQDGDLLFFGADRAKVVNDALGALRVKLGHDKGYAEQGWRPLWVVDFPMFEWDDEAKRWAAMHHPVHLAQGRARGSARDRSGQGAVEGLRHGAERLGDRRRIGAYPPRRGAVEGLPRARHLGGRSDAQVRLPAREPAIRRAAARRNRLRSGPHRRHDDGAESIRDVIAFPKTQRAQCLLTHAPSPVDEKQLRELGLRLRDKPKP